MTTSPDSSPDSWPTAAATPAAISLGAVNVAADDPERLGAFWSTVLGVTPTSPMPGLVILQPAPGGFGMMFMQRSDESGNRLHLDLTVPWGSREAEVERLVAAGAEWKWDVLEEVPWVRWTTLADPEGNLFCLGEHPPSP
ncbi:VOC family protein [Nocardioides abyssi]|uniref:VOC family protein n=1 Tax=Nocardioides abyssi TaxID=3058370 RepID=A0ABT8ERU0_9ACTN|nr:VOC family protein [Nocardioides abyssi]MDN4160872.1 VOC family protein [Nocardioides abyssi]